MENKYYTPEIEEFHDGFEFEISLNFSYRWERGRSTRLAEGEEYRKIIFSSGLQKIEDYVVQNSVEKNESAIRVKYLDKEDIESLGWVQGKLPYQFFMNPHFMLVKLEQSNWYSIVNTTDEDCRFRGIIKNKSELKKLMKQLNIV